MNNMLNNLYQAAVYNFCLTSLFSLRLLQVRTCPP